MFGQKIIDAVRTEIGKVREDWGNASRLFGQNFKESMRTISNTADSDTLAVGVKNTGLAIVLTGATLVAEAYNVTHNPSMAGGAMTLLMLSGTALLGRAGLRNLGEVGEAVRVTAPARQTSPFPHLRS